MARTKKLISVLLAIMLVFSLVPSFATVYAESEDELAVDAVLAWLDLGDTSNVTEDLDLPFIDDSELGTIITWSSSNTSIIWDNGTVLRPTTGTNVSVTMTATVTKGEVSKTKPFTVVVKAYEPSMRTIETIHADPNSPAGEFNIDVPVGSAPKLPWRVWVVYSDGYAEWRSTKWPWQAGSGNSTDPGGPGNGPPAVAGVWTPSNVETTWKGYPVGREYDVTGWITGTGSNTLGFPFSVHCKVIPVNEWREVNVPSNEVVADQLPPGKVTITGQNRLTSDATRSIARTAGYSPDTYLWNYRDTFGLAQPPGVSAPTGWESGTVRLRGHGVGHYLSSLALAYGSNLATTAQKTTLRNNMIYMIKTMREIQELTFYEVPADHPNSTANGGTGYREASNTWPHYPKDKATDAPDWKWPLMSEITTAPPTNFAYLQGRYWAEGQILADGRPAASTSANGTAFGSTSSSSADYMKSEKGEPEWFGYGYLNAIPPLHPALNEAYRDYSAWVWAPYYGIHKQLAGLMEIYYVFKDSTDPEEKATSDKALQICTDMSRWISDRLTKKARIEATTSTAYYGNMRWTWARNITGEYGGCNESIARCAYELDDNDPNKDLLIRGSEMFRNANYWEPLAVNSEIMSLDGNAHANSRIPNFPGVLWSYRGNANKEYYIMAKNHFDFNVGRYQYYNGGVGIGEWYKTPYTQISQIQSAGTGAETCCSYNLARLAKDLACFDPDNAEYTDQYERLFFNHLVGSLYQGGWQNTYLFFLGPGSNSDYGRGATPGESCCGGTSAETHVRYADATYLVSTDQANPKLWVNMYMPTEVTWDAAGVMVKQDCVWPSEKSTFTVQQLAGATAKTFDMHFRVPSWATGNFDIKRNGVSLAQSYAPGTFFVVEDVTTADTIVVEMEFTARLDYAPDKRNNNWVAAVFYGPMAMSFPGTQATWPGVLSINSNLSNIIRNGATDLANTSASTPGNNRTLYSMSIPNQPTTGNFNGTLRPSYYNTTTSTQPRPTHYFMVDLVPSGLDRTKLNEAINGARVIPSADYTTASFNALQTAIAAAVSVYQSDESTQAQIDAQVDLLKAASDGLILTQEAKADLLALINDAKARKTAMDGWDTRHLVEFNAAWQAVLADPGNDALRLAVRAIVEDPDGRPYAPRGYARMMEQLPAAQAAYDSDTATAAQVSVVFDALSETLRDMRPGYQPEPEDINPPDGLVYGYAIPSLTELVATAKAYNPVLYTEATYEALTDAIKFAEDEMSGIVGGSSTIHLGLIPDAIAQLTAAVNGLAYNMNLPVPVITSMTVGTNQRVAINNNATARVTATTATNEPLTYKWSAAPAIAGNTITGDTTATPTVNFANYGLYAVTVAVTDILGRTTTRILNVSVTAGSSLPEINLTRSDVYTAAEGNIARLASSPNVTQFANSSTTLYNATTGAGITRTGINATYANTTNGANNVQIPRINNGAKATATASSGWNTWGVGSGTGRTCVILNWGEAFTINSCRVDWWTDSNVAIPSTARVEWLDGTTWREVTNMKNASGAAVTNIPGAARGTWNGVTFDPVTTTQLRLSMARTGTLNNGIGMSEWEVFGVRGIPASAPKSDKTQLLEEILAFEALDPADYDEAVYNSVKPYYDAALAVLTDNQDNLDAEAAQAQTDAAADALSIANKMFLGETFVDLAISKDADKATAALTYASLDVMKGYIIIAAYEANGKLVSLDSRKLQINGYMTEEIEMNLQAGLTYKAFIWDEGLKPLHQAQSVIG